MEILAVSEGGLFLVDLDGGLAYLDIVLEQIRPVPGGIDRASVLGRQGWRDPVAAEVELAGGLEELARGLLAGRAQD